MNKLLSDPRVMLGLSLGVLAVAYIAWKGGVRGAAAGVVGVAGDVGRGVVEGAVDATENVFVGGVERIGQVFGIPKTTREGCCKAVMAGDEWGVSLHCTAANYLRYVRWSVGGPKPDFVMACES